MANGHINLPPENAVVYNAKKPKEKDGIIVISAQPGGKKRDKGKQEKVDNIFTKEKVIKYEL